MSDVLLFVHDGQLYQEPRYILESLVETEIQAWKITLFESAKEVDADHFIYATKTYDTGYEHLKRVDLYHVPLSDDEFQKRIDVAIHDAETKGEAMWFGVWHKGTAY